MENRQYFHLCANGDDARNFIVTEDDFFAAINLIGVCSFHSGVVVVCFSIEESHPHLLLFGTYEECLRFKRMYESSFMTHLVKTRGNRDAVVLDIEIILIDSEQYLMSVGTYIVIQATKDGKDIMPQDYPWSSGCLYFRRGPYTAPWMYDKKGRIAEARRVGDLSVNERRALLHSRKTVPSEWLVCNGFLLPSNYVDVERFESIYRTCNCYRVFTASSRKSNEIVLEKMSKARGVSMEDIEAKRVGQETCLELFGITDIRRLNAVQRVCLARALRKRHYLSFRQLATIVRVPESEVRKYVY